MNQRRYPDGVEVEVLRPSGEWVRSTVYGYQDRQGVWKYYVQLHGFAACSPDDENCWYADARIRPAH